MRLKAWINEVGYRLMTDANDIKLTATPRPFGVLKEHLVAFRPLRLTAMGFADSSDLVSNMHMPG